MSAITDATIMDGIQFLFVSFCISVGLMTIGVTLSIVITMVSAALNNEK